MDIINNRLTGYILNQFAGRYIEKTPQSHAGLKYKWFTMT